jgi:hypothetical protein
MVNALLNLARINLSMASLMTATTVVLMLAILTLSGMVQAADAACDGVQVSPGEDLAQVASAHPDGTTFCIQDGSYEVTSRVVAEDGDSFVGVYSDSTRPSISTTTADQIIYTTAADNVLVRALDISGAVHNNACEPNCGRGIGGSGNNLLIEDVRSHHNENQGVGGTGPGLLIRNSELDNNGNAESANDGGKVSAAGLKSTNSFTIEGSYIHDNYWNGVWCDSQCDDVEISDSSFTRNGKSAFSYEITDGTDTSHFTNNIVTNNGGLATANKHTGVLIESSRDLVINANSFSGHRQLFNGNGITVQDGSRPPSNGSLVISNNDLGGDRIKLCKGGCGTTLSDDNTNVGQ